MTRVLTTDDVQAADRFAYWREIICDVFVQLDAEPLEADGFEGRIDTTDLGCIDLSRVEAGLHHVARSARQIEKSDREDFLVSVQLAGRGLLVQDGREAPLDPGDFVLYDTTRPYVLHFADPFTQVVLQMPRAVLDERCPGLDRVTGARQHGKTPVGRVVHDFVSSLSANAASLDPDAASRLGETTADLLGVAFGSALGHETSLPSSSARVVHLRRIKSWIEAHLHEPDLSPTVVARASHVSVRYLHDLFTTEDVTLARWIRLRRLERCRLELADPRRAHRSITEIAFAWGFRDTTHFSRCFKATFGLSPREYRATHAG